MIAAAAGVAILLLLCWMWWIDPEVRRRVDALGIYGISLLVSFCAVFLKGFQHKNVIGGHLKLVAITSYAMAVFDVATIIVVYKGGWWTALSAGTGAAIGMVTAILLHDHLLGTSKRDSKEKDHE